MNISKLIQNGRWETETKWETLLQMSSSLIPFRLLLCSSTEGKFTLCSLLLWIWTFVLSHLHPMFWCCGWIYRVCCQSEQKEFLVSLVVFWWCQVWVSSVHVGNQRIFSATTTFFDTLWQLKAFATSTKLLAEKFLYLVQTKLVTRWEDEQQLMRALKRSYNKAFS